MFSVYKLIISTVIPVKMSCFCQPVTPSSSSLPPRKSRSFCTKSRTRGCTLRGLQEPPTLSEMPLHGSLIVPIFSHLFSFQDLIEKPAYSAPSLHFPAGAFFGPSACSEGEKNKEENPPGGSSLTWERYRGLLSHHKGVSCTGGRCLVDSL